MRLFIATTFPDAVMRELGERVSRIKSRLPPASWVRPETQHLTFAFLGEQKDSLAEELVPVVEKQLEDVAPFEGSLRSCGFFPNPRHARVAWVGADPEEKFRAIAADVREAVKIAGVTLDGSEFKPHLTLGRIRDPWPPACIETFNRALRDYASEKFMVDHVTLFSSKLNPGGAVHTPIREFRLSTVSV